MTNAMTEMQIGQADREFTAAWTRAEDSGGREASSGLRAEVRRTARRLVELAGEVVGDIDGLDLARVRAEFRAYIDGFGRPTRGADVADLAAYGRHITLQLARLEAGPAPTP